jgi:hypothetical protein
MSNREFGSGVFSDALFQTSSSEPHPQIIGILPENDADRERSRFADWMMSEAKIDVRSSDPYPAGLTRDYWRVWQAAISRRDRSKHSRLETRTSDGTMIYSCTCGSDWRYEVTREVVLYSKAFEPWRRDATRSFEEHVFTTAP